MFTIYIYGSEQVDTYPPNSTEWLSVDIIGLDYEPRPAGESKRTKLGATVYPKKREKHIVIRTAPIAFDDYFTFVDALSAMMAMPYIYFRRGDYPEVAQFALPDNSLIAPTGRNIEHEYQNGTKSIDVECVFEGLI